MKCETYRKAQLIANDIVLCKEVIRFVDSYTPYKFKIVLHDREFDCPPWMYLELRDICDKKKDELTKQFEEL